MVSETDRKRNNRIMELVCRICLAADRKLFVLDTKHKELYINVTGITVQPKDRLPKHICWECRHLMSKYYMFKKKAVLNHFIIMEITQNKTFTSLEEHQPISTLTCTGIVYLNFDGVDNEELEEIEFKSEADQIIIQEEETNFTSYDNHDMNVIRDNTLTDYLYDQPNLTTKETVEIDTKIKEENVENEIPEDEIVRNETEIKSTEKNVKNLNNIEIPEDYGKNDFDIESTENTVENLNSNEILDNLPSDYTDDDNDGVDNEELEEIEFINEADQISVWEEETNFSSYDNDNINVVRDNKAKDYLYDQANLTRKATVEIVTNTEINEENVQNVRNELPEEIVRNDNEIIEKTIKNLNPIEISEDDGINDIHIKSTENTVENLNSNEILDNPPSDYTDCAPNGNDEISSKSIKNISSEPIDETSKSKKKLELDKTLRTVTMLSKEEQIAEKKKKEKHYNYVNVNPKFTEPTVFNGIEFAKTLRVELRKYNAPAEYAQLYGAPLKKPKADSLKVKNNSNVSNEESVKTVNLDANVSELFKKTEHWDEAKNLTDYSETVVGEKNNSLIETCKDKFICDDCGHQFHNKDSIILHLKEKHLKDVYIGYKKSAYSSVTKDRLEKHSELNHEIRKYFCDICNNGFTSNIILKRHIAQRCKIRNNVSNTHLVVEPYLCTKCGRKFNLNHEEFKRHMRTHSAEKPYSCAVCDKQYYHSSSLNTHMRIHTGKNPHFCTMCEKQFIRRADLNIHMRTHTGQKPYSCAVCNRQFTYSNGLNSHMRTHTGQKPYSCTICNKQFSQNLNLNMHMRTHTHQKPYSCEICNKQFSQRSNLNVHIRTHSGQKPYACKVCTRQFNESSSLKKHMRIHTGEKPYSCAVCNRQFTHSHSLNTHKRIHTGQKPYSCTMCDKQFIRNDYLKSHMRTHKGEKPYAINN